jgi:uncharacterized protein with ATP-grasp and redox domains
MAAVRLAAAGNLLDVGAKTQVEGDAFPRALQQAMEAPLHGSVEALLKAVQQARRILFLADNAGEIVFDRALLEQLPLDRVTLVVRGAPVLNDATMEDAFMAGVTDQVATIPNGSDAPGTFLDDCSLAFQSLYAESDLILAKGQGNFETLASADKHAFFLFSVKCDVVARLVDCPVGSLVLHQHRPGANRVGSGEACRKDTDIGSP